MVKHVKYKTSLDKGNLFAKRSVSAGQQRIDTARPMIANRLMRDAAWGPTVLR